MSIMSIELSNANIVKLIKIYGFVSVSLLSAGINRIFLQRQTLDECKYCYKTEFGTECKYCHKTEFGTVASISLIIFFKKIYRKNNFLKVLTLVTPKYILEKLLGQGWKRIWTYYNNHFVLVKVCHCIPGCIAGVFKTTFEYLRFIFSECSKKSKIGFETFVITVFDKTNLIRL